MKISKRILSIVLSALMVVTMLPTFAISAFADGKIADEYQLTAQSAENLTPASINGVGKFSNYDAPAGTYSNLLYQGTAFSEVGEDKDYLGHGVNVQKKTVIVYDGDHDAVLPVYARFWPTGGSNVELCYTALNQSVPFALNSWTGSCYINTSNPGKVLSVTNSDAMNNVMDHDAIRTSFTTGNHSKASSGMAYVFWTGMKYTGSGNTSSYYDKYSNIKYRTGHRNKIALSWYNRTYDYTPTADIYVINYKPLYDVIKNNSKVSALDSTYSLKDLYSEVYNNEAKYTASSVRAFYSAVKNLTSVSFTNFTSDDQITDSNVANIATSIKNVYDSYVSAASALAVNEYTVVFKNSAGSVVKTETVKHGNMATAPANSATTYAQNSASVHDKTTYKWPVMTAITANTTIQEQKETVQEDHSWQETAVKVEPTCSATGKTAVETCEFCNLTKGGSTISANTAKEYHSYTTQDVSSTCKEAGYTLYTCSNCTEETENHSYKDNYKQLAAHTPGEPVREKVTPLTYEEVVYCVNCPAEISRVEKKNIQIIDSNDADASEKATVTVETVEEKQVATVTVDNVADEDARFIGWFDAEGNLLSMEKDYVITGEESAIKAVVDNEAKNDVNATVKNNIGANFYIDTLYYVDDPETDITITYNQDINAYTDRFVQKTVKVKDLDFNADMQSIINIDVAPAQIDKKITISFEDENGDVISFNKTVMDYCNDVINGAHSFADKNAAKKVINYAYAVQQYFFINEYEYLQSIETAFNTEPTVEFGQVSACAPTVKKTSTCPITVSEISIVAVTDTGVRIYYTGNASNLEFQASNGYTVTKGDGYVEISGIKAADLGNEFVVQAKNSDNKVVFQAKLSAMSYVYLALQDGKKWSVEYNRFLGAFYEYWQAALAL